MALMCSDAAIVCREKLLLGLLCIQDSPRGCLEAVGIHELVVESCFLGRPFLTDAFVMSCILSILALIAFSCV